MNIQLELTTETQSYPLRKNSQYRNALKKEGIRFVHENPDLRLIHASLLNDQIKESGAPIIVLERIDASVVMKKEDLKNSKIKAIIKNTKLRPDTLNNLPTHNERYHTTKILESVDNKQFIDSKHYKEAKDDILINANQNIVLTENEFKKIFCGYSFCHYEKMNNIIDLAVNFDKHRAIDAHFIGTIEYGSNESISHHRRTCLTKMKELRNNVVICNSGRPQKFKDYISCLLNTKIVVSPWGHGEACYRDFEAIYCGAVLIKPDTSFVDCWPDIYQNNITYVPCRADFSDLNQKVEWIKANWEHLKEMRKNTLELVREARKPDNFAKHMAEIFTKCKEL